MGKQKTNMESLRRNLFATGHHPRLPLPGMMPGVRGPRTVRVINIKHNQLTSKCV